MAWGATQEESVSMGHSHAKLSEKYRAAISVLNKHIRRAKDGTFHLEVRDAREFGIDPVVFADLVRSIDETNRKIKAGIIDPNTIPNHIE